MPLNNQPCIDIPFDLSPLSFTKMKQIRKLALTCEGDAGWQGELVQSLSSLTPSTHPYLEVVKVRIETFCRSTALPPHFGYLPLPHSLAPPQISPIGNHVKALDTTFARFAETDTFQELYISLYHRCPEADPCTLEEFDNWAALLPQFEHQLAKEFMVDLVYDRESVDHYGEVNCYISRKPPAEKATRSRGEATF